MAVSGQTLIMGHNDHKTGITAGGGLKKGNAPIGGGEQCKATFSSIYVHVTNNGPKE